MSISIVQLFPLLFISLSFFSSFHCVPVCPLSLSLSLSLSHSPPQQHLILLSHFSFHYIMEHLERVCLWLLSAPLLSVLSRAVLQYSRHVRPGRGPLPVCGLLPRRKDGPRLPLQHTAGSSRWSIPLATIDIFYFTICVWLSASNHTINYSVIK